MMKYRSKAGLIAAAFVGLGAASAPASAALTISFPVGATSGFFGDSNIAPGTAYNQSAPFFLSSSGAGTFSISSTDALFKLTGAFIDKTPFALTSLSPFDFGGLTESIASGFHTLTVVGNGDAPAGSTGSYGGQLTFTPSAVPEPASWAMMIGGIGFMGGALRRRAKREAGSVAFA